MTLFVVVVAVVKQSSVPVALAANPDRRSPISGRVRHSLETEEQRALRYAEELRQRDITAHQEAIRRAQEVLLHKDRLAADTRAEVLLLEHVTTEQRKQYRRHKHIVVEGRSGTRYRIRKGRIGNVDVIDELGRVAHRLCAHPRDDVPDCDTVLAQKFWIETDEDAFLRAANRHASFDRVTRVLPALQ